MKKQIVITITINEPEEIEHMVTNFNNIFNDIPDSIINNFLEEPELFLYDNLGETIVTVEKRG